jgi:PTS system nitrogen regulatory IIA component
MSDTRVANVNGAGLACVFSQDCIERIPKGATKQGVLEQLLRALANVRHLEGAQVPGLVQTLLERERAGSTALGKGLAMPHLRTEAVVRFVGAVGLAPEGINFQSIDGDPTKLIFLVLGPYEQRERHFELMGRLSALMRDKSTLMFLQGRRTPRDVFEYLVDLDARSGEAPGAAWNSRTLSENRTTPIIASRGKLLDTTA